MFKNMSIRTRILIGVILVNLVGALAISVYLHQSFSRALEYSAARTLTVGSGAWTQIAGPKTDPATEPDKIAATLDKLSAITGGQYGFLVSKDAVDAKTYANMRKKLNLPDNYSEGDTLVQLAVSKDANADAMKFDVAAADVPESGRVVGVENGACSQTCHANVSGSGSYWGVRWSSDSKTRAHAVFPVLGPTNQPVGVVYAIEDLTAQADAARSSTMDTLLVVIISLVVATGVISLALDMFVLRRINKLTAAMEDIGLRVAGGDFTAQFVPDETTDEIGKFETFFAKLVNLVSATLRQLSEDKDQK